MRYLKKFEFSYEDEIRDVDEFVSALKRIISDFLVKRNFSTSANYVSVETVNQSKMGKTSYTFKYYRKAFDSILLFYLIRDKDYLAITTQRFNVVTDKPSLNAISFADYIFDTIKKYSVSGKNVNIPFNSDRVVFEEDSIPKILSELSLEKYDLWLGIKKFNV